MGSSIKSPFLLPSVLVYIVHKTLSGRMTLKVIVILCLVLVGLMEANPVSMEATEAPDAELYKTDDTEITTDGYEYEYTTEDSYNWYNWNDYDIERKKRSPKKPCKPNPLRRIFCP